MGFIIFLVIASPIILLIVFMVCAHKDTQKINAQISSSSFTPDYTYSFPSGRLCVCQSDRTVMIVYPNRTQYLSFDDLLSVEMFIDGKSTYGRSTGKVIGASLIGGVIGAMCVDQDEKKTCTDLHVDIGTRIIGSPTITLQFVEFDTEDITIQRKQAMDIVNTIRAIIDENEKLYQSQLAAAQAQAIAQSVQQSVPSPASAPATSIAASDVAEEPASEPLQPASHEAATSVADEIRKFAQLYQDGIISEEEFNDMKSELLNAKK